MQAFIACIAFSFYKAAHALQNTLIMNQEYIACAAC
jgi:hypothetical protein